MNTHLLHILFYVLFLTFMILNVFGNLDDSKSSANDANLQENQPEVHCVFVHGESTLPEPGTDPIQTDINNLPLKLRTYWGDVKKWTETPNSTRLPCTSYAFTYLDTVHNAWNNEFFADVVCRALMTESNIRAKQKHQRIFLHSMGNLIFYNALHTQKCKINEFPKVNAGVNAKEENNIYSEDLNKDTYNTHVYSFGGTFRGTDMVDVARKACEAKKTVNVLQWLANAVEDYVFRPISSLWDSMLGKVESPEVRELLPLVCDPETHNLTKSLESLDWLDRKKHGEISIATIKDIYRLSKKYTTGAICGSKSEFNNNFVLNKDIADQLKSFHRIRYGDGDPVIGFDGVVDVNSCTGVNDYADWKRTFLLKDTRKSNLSGDLFWVVDLNHNAIIGRYGDPEILDWLEKMK